MVCFFGLGFVAALGFFVFGFRPTAFLPAGVLGPGLEEVDALVDLLAGVRPVWAFGRLAGLAVEPVA